MIRIRRAKTLSGEVVDLELDSEEELLFDASGLTLFPALIDPHVHFRTPGAEFKENWISGAKGALRGGVTTVFDMPNTSPPTTTGKRLKEKLELIRSQLAEAGIPLRHRLYFGADAGQLEEIPLVKDQVVGIKVYMGQSTGDLLVDEESSLEQVFRAAAESGLIVSVHAEDEQTIRRQKQKIGPSLDPADHSRIRSPEAALKATERAIELAAKYGTRLCILHLSTKKELEAVSRAKREGLSVFAEVAPHHLLFDLEDYGRFGTLLQMNPPLRTREDREALWRGIEEGSVDFIGSDHAPHTLEEKRRPFGSAPSGVPSIELLLPLLATHFMQRGIPLERIVRLSKERIEQIFSLEPNEDLLLVDFKRKKRVEESELKSRCGWSPYCGMELVGWPVAALLEGRLFLLEEMCPIR